MRRYLHLDCLIGELDSVEIRETIPSDRDAVREVHKGAFDPSESDTVSQLAIELLDDESARPILSLVAEKDQQIVGSIIFTSIKVEDANPMAGSILAPLAVSKSCQGTGIGTALINRGVQILQERGVKFVMVYGDPAYYGRSDFHRNHNLEPPYQLEYPDAWMARDIEDGALTQIQGKVVCAAPLMAPEHW